MLIGIDDTDSADSRGTGKLARRIAAELVLRGLGASRGVTRHQLLVDPRIPYTSHNSSACIELETDRDPAEVWSACCKVMRWGFVAGSDPGLCVALGPRLPEPVVEFGRSAQQRVLDRREALRTARDWAIALEPLGGTGLGVIGALAAVGLRASGNDGRFIELESIRVVGGVITAGELTARAGLAEVRSARGGPLAADACIDTQGWLRPRLVGGAPVLVVEPHPTRPAVWVSVDRRNSSGHHRQTR